MTIIVAVIAIYATDFAINVVQSTSRSLIVDTLPISQQQLGSAWGQDLIYSSSNPANTRQHPVSVLLAT